MPWGFPGGWACRRPAGGDDLPGVFVGVGRPFVQLDAGPFGRPVIVPGRLNTPPPGGWWRPSDFQKCLSVSGDHLFSSTQGLWASRHCSRTVEHAATRRVVATFQEVFVGGVGRPFGQLSAGPSGVLSLFPAVERAAARRVVVPFRKCFAGFGDTVQLIEQTVLGFRQQARKRPRRADVFAAFVRCLVGLI